MDLLVDAIKEMVSQFLVDMMGLITDVFTDLLSCNLSLFEELFSVVGSLYQNVIVPMGIALLLMILIWQLFKSMFGKVGINAEEPIELIGRSSICLFFVVASKPVINYILKIAGTPYQWVIGTDIKVQSFSEYVTALEGITAPLGLGTVSIATAVSGNSRRNAADGNIKREKRRVAEIGSEVEELKRKLKEAKKSEKLEKREKRQQERERKNTARLQKRQDVQEEKLRKKEDRLQAQKEKREAVARFHEQEAEERSLRKNLAVQTEEETVKEKQPIPVKDTEPVETKGREENAGDLDILPVTWASSYLPISQIKNGVIQTKDERYIKIIEILPINFLLRSAPEKRNIIYSFASYLKIAPPNLQFKILSKKADIKDYIEKIRREAEQEPDERCRILQEDYTKLLTQLGTREAITRRFFLIFEYPLSGTKSVNERDMFLYLQSAVQTAKKYLAMCGNVVLEHKNETRFCVEVFYQLLNRDTCLKTTLDERIEKVRNHYILENGKESVAKIPVTELIAPDSLNFKSYKYVILDGIYHAYLYIPSASL